MGVLRYLPRVLGSISMGVSEVSPSPLEIIPMPHEAGIYDL